jgi:hypothetical protein
MGRQRAVAVVLCPLGRQLRLCLLLLYNYLLRFADVKVLF